MRRKWQGSEGQNSLNDSDLVVQIYATISSVVVEVGRREMRCKGIRDFEGTDAGCGMRNEGWRVEIDVRDEVGVGVEVRMLR